MSDFHLGNMLKVNGHFLHACLTGTVAWFSVPEPDGYPLLWVMVFLMGAGCVGSVLAALRLMGEDFLRAWRLRRLRRKGDQPRTGGGEKGIPEAWQ